MKQVININFHGQIVPIEVSAFDLLKLYTASLTNYFKNEEGKEEIINDIESRIAELFQERLKKGVTCITDDDVNAIIKSMGRPEEFEGEEPNSFAQSSTASAEDTTGSGQAQQAAMPNTTDYKRLFRDENDKVLGGVCAGLANYFGIDRTIVRVIFVVLIFSFGFGLIPYFILWIALPSSATNIIGGTRKRLFRDPEDKKIAGVCSGIGNYFGINPWIPRVLFLLPFLSVVFNGNYWGLGDFGHFLRVGFSPGALLIYIILWLVIPEAGSTAEKLEMKGSKVDLNTIKNSVVEEMKGMQSRAEKLGHEARAFAETKGKTMGAEMGSAVKRSSRSLGDIIVFIVKAFAYFIIGCFGFAFVVGLFAFAIASIGVFPLKDYLLTDGWQNFLAWGTLILFIAVPVIGIITWIIRRLAKIKSNRRILRFTFVSLWIVGLACFIALIVSVGRDFRSVNDINEQEIVLANPGVNKLELTTNSPQKKYYRNNNWLRFEPFQNLDEDSVFVENISIKILKSTNDSFKVTILKMANGSNRRNADTLARGIQYSVAQRDSLLILGKGIVITKDNKFRNQRIILTVYVPVGKHIKIDKSIGRSNSFRFNGPWNNNDFDIDIAEEEKGWQEDVDYVMQTNGLHTLSGKAADDWKNGDKNNENNEGNDDNNEAPKRTTQGDGYRYNNTTPKIDSLKMNLQKEQQQYKDSLIKEQNEIKRKQEENEQKLKKINVITQTQMSEESDSYTLQSYSPLACIGLI